MAREKAETEQITLRVPEDWLLRASVLAEIIAPDAGPTFSRTDVFRAALGHGLRELEARMQISVTETPARQKPARETRTRLPSRAR